MDLLSIPEVKHINAFLQTLPPHSQISCQKFQKQWILHQDPSQQIGYKLGKAGNLTDLTLGMVLTEKPPAWLQVMHERLKHLIISSETFKEKKKAEYDARAKAK